MKLPVLRFCEALARGVQKSQAAATKQAIGLLAAGRYRAVGNLRVSRDWMLQSMHSSKFMYIAVAQRLVPSNETNEDWPHVWLTHFGTGYDLL